MDEGVVEVPEPPAAGGHSIMMTATIEEEEGGGGGEAEKTWEELGEGGSRFEFPAVASFPRAPKFVGGRREFPSGEEARINEIQATTFRAFVNICPDFHTIAPIIAEEDKRNKIQVNDQIKRRGSTGGPSALSSSAPTLQSSGQQPLTDEQKSRRSLFGGRRKSTNMDQMAAVDQSEAGKTTDRKNSKKEGKRDRGPSTGRRTGDDSKPGPGSHVKGPLSAQLTPEEVALYKEQMIKKYEQQQDLAKSSASLAAVPLTAPPSLNSPGLPPPPLTAPTMPPPRVNPTPTEDLSPSPIPTPIHTTVVPPPPTPTPPPEPSSSPSPAPAFAPAPAPALAPAPVTPVAPPLVMVASSPAIAPPAPSAPVRAVKPALALEELQPSPELLSVEGEQTTTSKRFSLKSALRLSSIRGKKEDDPDYALESKYGKHMVSNPLNELLDY